MFSLIQAGATLQLVDARGTLTPLGLPAGITLRTDVPPRFVVYGRYVILVNTPTRPITIDESGAMRPLTPLAPRLAPILTGVAGGTLSGTYNHGRYTFVLMDETGNLIAESDFSPASSADVTITSQDLQYSSLDRSTETISARRCYRTTTNGSVLFQWVDLDGNVLTAVQDDLPDAGLSETAAPTLGTPPRLTLIAEFRDRLFGVGDVDIDSVAYTETGLMYAWPALNRIPIPRVGSDLLGVTAFLGRRESLGVGRLNRLSAITGSGEETAAGDVDLRVIKLSDQCGVVSNESVTIWRDVATWLWLDGVYQWSDNGIVCVSDGQQGIGRVRSWFTTDDYFDRTQFPHAFAQVDTVTNKYRLFLIAVDGTRQFVEFDFAQRTWDGPHTTAAFTPTCAFMRSGDQQVQIPMIGGADGGIYQQVATSARDVSVGQDPYGIDFDVDTKFYVGASPDHESYFGQLSLLGAVQAAGTIAVTPKVGYLDAPAQPPIVYDMRRGRQRLRRLGFGKLAQLNLKHTTVDEPVILYGFEVDDVHDGGRR
jgi:hypothetical protein